MLVYEIRADVYNEKLAETLKSLEEFKMPDWARFVKTSSNRERPPLETDWWYKRAASILRQLYVHEIVGVERLRTRYGGRKNRGQKPEKFRKGSGKIIRVILQQAEAAGFVEKIKTTKKAGRKLTEKGRAFLESIKNEEGKLKPQDLEVLGEETKIEEVKEDNKSEDIKENKEIEENVRLSHDTTR